MATLRRKEPKGVSIRRGRRLGLPQELWRRSFEIPEYIRERFPNDSEIIETRVNSDRVRYRNLGRYTAGWHRAFGFSELFLSITLPLIIQVGDGRSTEASNNVLGLDFLNLLTAISVLIALLGAMRAFFAWEDRVSLYRSQEALMSRIFANWQIRILTEEPSRETDLKSERSPRGLHQATVTALEQVVSSINHEVDQLSSGGASIDDILAAAGKSE